MNLLDYDNLLTLLRNAITGESRALSSAPNWQVLTSQARVHGVEPLVYDAALRLPDEQRPDKALATQMKQICLYQMQQQTLWLPRIKAAVTALRKAGIEPAQAVFAQLGRCGYLGGYQQLPCRLQSLARGIS